MQIGSLKLVTTKLLEYNSIVIFHHIRPDGDCLGSQFGLAELIKVNFPDKKVYCVGDAKNTFSFLNLKHDLVPNKKILKQSLAVIVDANFKERIESRELLDENLFAEIVRIDHHPNDDDLGDNTTRWVDSSYVAADEMITEIAFVNNWIITEAAANLLYLGINTDSGRFLYNNTSARTLELVAHLYKNNLNVDFIHKNLAATSLEDLKFQSWLLSTLKTRDGVAYIQNSYLDTIKFNKTPQSSVRPNLIANIKGYPLWVQFTEEETGKIRVEFRSNGPIVRNVAIKWGGGGHERASGAIINSFEQVEAVIDDCKIEVERFLNSQI
ncbi:DHH family phosphoesterase [Mycoplasmopsis cricetuli]|uniref:DHH family phosphoesterase n=1 Tax=Mycoplasmopsis cricetuli TaxID=171283 RepID=UPI000472841E